MGIGSVPIAGREGKGIVVRVCIVEYYLVIKPMKSRPSEQHGWTLRASCRAKERNPSSMRSLLPVEPKANKTRLIDTESRMVVVRGGAWEVREMGKGVKK